MLKKGKNTLRRNKMNLFGWICLSALLLSACQSNEPTIVHITESSALSQSSATESAETTTGKAAAASDQTTSLAETAAQDAGTDTTADTASDTAPTSLLKLYGADGSMTYELVDAWVTSHPKDLGVDLDRLDPYSYVYMQAHGEDPVGWPDYFKDPDMDALCDGCRMFVCRIKVTNIDAVYAYEDAYESPYIFRADNITLNYIPSNMDTEQITSKNIDYYSLRQEDDHLWATYELKPGESLTYDIGFVMGDEVLTPDGLAADLKPSDFYLGNMSGPGEESIYYEINWKEG